MTSNLSDAQLYGLGPTYDDQPDYSTPLASTAPPPYMRAPGDQDACLAAVAEIKAQWIDELKTRTSEVSVLRTLVVGHRRWLVALAIISIVATIALAVLLSWYIPLRIKVSKST